MSRREVAARPRIAVQSARFLGIFLVVLGVAGWYDLPVVGAHGYLAYNTTLHVAHLALGLYLFCMSTTTETNSAVALFTVSGACLLFSAFSLWQLGSADEGGVLDYVLVSRNGEYLHLTLAIVMGVLGKCNTASTQLFGNRNRE